MKTEQLFMEMMTYLAGKPGLIHHFIKVHSFAKRIGIAEQLDEKSLAILETAAIVHDIGIKASQAKYGDCSGKHQEELGPALAESLLNQLDYPKEMIDRVCYLVGHHHTYSQMDGLDYQILVEADFLVNIYEGSMSKDATASVLQKVFKTETGIKLCKMLYQIDQVTQQ